MNHRFFFTNFIPLLALPLVILIPQVGQLFSSYSSWLLGAILFFSFLGMGLDDLWNVLRRPAKAFYVSLMILVLTPLVIYPVMQRFFPEYFLGAILFMLLPSAVSAPAVTAIYGGNVALASVNTLVSSLLSPFTIPLFFRIFLRTEVQVDLGSVFLKLLFMVVIPFVLAVLANRHLQSLVRDTRRHFRAINLALLLFFFFAALSPYRQELILNFANGHLWLAVLVAYALLYIFAKLSLLYASEAADRIAVQSNLLFLNVGLGLVIAQNYFGPTEVLFILFAEIVWLFLIGLFKYFR